MPDNRTSVEENNTSMSAKTAVIVWLVCAAIGVAIGIVVALLFSPHAWGVIAPITFMSLIVAFLLTYHLDEDEDEEYY